MIVYLITNCVNGKQYVGQTVQQMEKRFARHVWSKDPLPLHRAMRKHGTDNFRLEQIKECASKQEMDQVEREWIAKLGTLSPAGYNITLGGGGSVGFKHSEESKKRMTAWQLGKKLSPEHKAKVSAALRGNTYARGFVHSPETRAKISAALRGRKHAFTEEHIRNIALAARKRPKPSPETRAKMSAAKLRRHATHGSPPMSEGQRQKLRDWWAVRRANGEFKTAAPYAHWKRAELTEAVGPARVAEAA
jgi:group I intron endonuclease